MRGITRLGFPLLFLGLPLFITTVKPQEQGDSARQRMINESTDPLLASFRFRSIGPASMGGRIDDIAVSESDPNIIYIGYAVGGVFKSENNATTFEPVFDTYSTIVTISESPILPGVVWVGTDDGNLQMSRDGGVSFTEVGKNLPGLPPNHQYWISRVDASHFDAGTAYV